MLKDHRRGKRMWRTLLKKKFGFEIGADHFWGGSCLWIHLAGSDVSKGAFEGEGIELLNALLLPARVVRFAAFPFSKLV